jgi:peptidyl-prolyl cis-trans isomerase D
MLEFFRQHIGGGLLGLVLVGLLAAAFAFSFGAQSKGWGEGQSEQIAAAAAGYDISDNTLEYAFNLMGGRGLDRDDGEGVSLKMAALDGLVERSLLLDMASDIGITATTDEAVNNIIHNRLMLTRSVTSLLEKIEAYPFFDAKDAADVVVTSGHRIPQTFENDEGKFNTDFYKNFVRNHLRQTEDDFIEQQRLEIIAERMRRLLVGAVRVSDDEARLEYDRDNDTASVKYIRVMPAYFSDKLKPTPEELTTWIAAHKEDIKKNYESNQYKYTDLEEQVRARHILIRAGSDAKPEEKAAAKAKIDAALTRAKSGEDFAALSKELSEDTVSAAKGGDLGYTPRGRMVPEFDKVMFATKPGEISDVVETKYGYHIIKVEGVRKGNVSLEEATPEIADEMYRTEKATAEAKAAADGYLARIKAGETMEAVVPPEGPDNKGPFSIKVQTSRPFAKTAKTIPGVGPANDMIKAAFEDSKEAKIYTVNGDTFVVQNDARSKPNDEEFTKLKDGIKDKLLSMKQALLLSQQIKALRDKAETEGKIKIIYKPQTVSSSKDESDAPKSKSGAENKGDKAKGKAKGKGEKKSAEKKPAGKGADEAGKDEAAEPAGE